MLCRIILILMVLLGALPVHASDTQDVNAALDGLHEAAARGDAVTYLALLAPDIVFLGTDGSERWQGREFRDFVEEHFVGGRGWTYVSTGRRISLAGDGHTAWFDEDLANEKLGHCRGSGVLIKGPKGWQIAQYNLSVPIPNAMVLSVVEGITALEKGSSSGH